MGAIFFLTGALICLIIVFFYVNRIPPSSDSYYPLFLGLGLILLSVYLLFWFFDLDQCEQCNVIFYWSDNSVRGESRDDAYNQANKEIEWKRNGGVALEFVRYPLKYHNTCLACKHINECSSFFEKTEWEQHGDPFPVKDCPFCNGKGSAEVCINNFKRSRGKAACGFCKSRGYVALKQLKELTDEVKKI